VLQLAARIKELEVDLEQEYERRAKTDSEHQEMLESVHDQLSELGEERNSLFEQNKRLASNLIGTCSHTCLSFILLLIQCSADIPFAVSKQIA
jgi:hypothetical protein